MALQPAEPGQSFQALHEGGREYGRRGGAVMTSPVDRAASIFHGLPLNCTTMSMSDKNGHALAGRGTLMNGKVCVCVAFRRACMHSNTSITCCSRLGLPWFHGGPTDFDTLDVIYRPLLFCELVYFVTVVQVCLAALLQLHVSRIGFGLVQVLCLGALAEQEIHGFKCETLGLGEEEVYWRKEGGIDDGKDLISVSVVRCCDAQCKISTRFA